MKYISIDVPAGKTPKSVTIDPDWDHFGGYYRFYHKTEMFYGRVVYMLSMDYPINITD